MPLGPLARHCRRKGCPCSHERCDRGWIDRDDEHGHTISTAPCPLCRTELAEVVLGSPTDRDRQASLAQRRGDPVYRTPPEELVRA